MLLSLLIDTILFSDTVIFGRLNLNYVKFFTKAIQYVFAYERNWTFTDAIKIRNMKPIIISNNSYLLRGLYFVYDSSGSQMVLQKIDL